MGYRNKKNKSLFERSSSYKSEINSLKSDISDLRRKVHSVNNPNIKNEIQVQLADKKDELNSVTKKYSDLKKRIISLASVLGISALLGVAAYGNVKDKNNFEILNNAGESISDDLFDSDSKLEETPDLNHNSEEVFDSNSKLEKENLSYKAFIQDLLDYIELNQREHLDENDKHKLENIKSRIKSNPQSINQLSRDILRQKIATSMGIDDYSRIDFSEINYDVKGDQLHHEIGHIQNITISLDNKTIALFNQFQSYANGEITIRSNSIPKEVKEAITTISKAQNSENFNDAVNGLNNSLNVNSDHIVFSEKENEIENEK